MHPGGVMANNPRYSNGNARRKLVARVRAQAGECGICRGLRGPIHYDEPSDAAHPLSFVLDEIHPVKYWREYGYPSPTAAALDPANVQAAHRCCNSEKGARDGWHVGDAGSGSAARVAAQPVVTSRRR